MSEIFTAALNKNEHVKKGCNYFSVYSVLD